MSCPDCFRGGVHDHGGEVQGSMQTLHGYECYITPAPARSPPPSSSSSSSTIILYCDGFGLELVNNKILCDRYAAGTGMRVIAPAIIPGGPAPISVLADMDDLMGAGTGNEKGEPVAWSEYIWAQLRRVRALLRIVRVMLPFVFTKAPSRGYGACLRFARAVRADMVASTPGAKLGVAGFCWGGYSSVNLCREAAVAVGGQAVEGNGSGGGSDGKQPENQQRLVDAQFCAHPSGLTPPRTVLDAVTAFGGTPFSMAVGDRDFLYGEKKVLETEAALRRQVGPPEDNDYEVRLYRGCRHGFAVRAFPGDKVEMMALEEARQQAIDWFRKYL